MTEIERYRAFIASRAVASRAVASRMQGFEPHEINPMAKAHQRAALDFALRLSVAA